VLFIVATQQPAASPLGLLATFGAVLAMLRAVTFIHEIAHRAREIPGFEAIWNAFVGLPMGVPSLLYVASHPGHHRTRQYGTPADPEYAPLARWGTGRRILFVAASGLAPLLLALRWGVVGPLSLLVPGLRRLSVARLSTLAINPGYLRDAPTGAERRRWLVQEASAAAIVWSVGLALAADLVPAAVVARWIIVVGGVFLINQLRTVMAHRYALDGRSVDDRGQLLDSVTLPEHSLFAPLIAPLGLRFHALHHWAPGIPYHDLGRVHRQLRAEAAPDDAYARTLAPDLGAALRTNGSA
jgi:fatty acid desaturase